VEDKFQLASPQADEGLIFALIEKNTVDSFERTIFISLDHFKLI